MQRLFFLKTWFLLAMSTTLICALVYLVIQQGLRQTANDPQIQMAEDNAALLNAGKQASDYNALEKIDIAKSLSPYLIIYNSQGKPIASDGKLNDISPTLPSGVFDAATQKGQNRITWQPRATIRSALVIVPYKDGYVVAGRSLREVEQRESNLLITSVIVWAFTIILTLATTFFFYKNENKKGHFDDVV